MKKRVSYLSMLTIIFVLALSVFAGAADFRSIEGLIETKDVTRIQEAIDRLEAHLQDKPADGEALWLIAKAHLYLGDRTEDDKLAILEMGKSYAEAAIEVLPNSPHPYYWQASLSGRIGQARGIMSSLFMVRPMKESLDRALELDDDYADAHWVLSQLYHQAPGFPLSIGNKKSSLQHAERALELEPANFDYQLQFAVALEYNGRKQEAIEVLEALLAEPNLKKDPDTQADAEKAYREFTK